MKGRKLGSAWLSSLGMVLPATGCGTSEIDVIVRAVQDAPPGPNEAPSEPALRSPESIGPPPPGPVVEDLDAGAFGLPDASPCALGSVVLVNRYRFVLRSDGRCLVPGVPPPPPAPGMLAASWYSALTEDCEVPGALWQLVQGREGSFEIRNTRWNMNLEIEYSGTRAGTDAVLSLPNNFAAQRFLVSERERNYAALTPLHALNRCLGSSQTGKAELADCEDDTPSQEWLIEVEGCGTVEPGSVSSP
jgi:hypothetical protein